MNRERPGAANEPPSKSQRKRDARVLFDLGRELVGLDPARLSDMPLEPNLLEQIEIARGIRAHVARKRQLQFIAKLLRRMDTAPIEAAMGACRLASRRQAARLHHIEAWRDSLLAGGDVVVAELVEACPGADPQRLRQLLRNARREAALDKPPAAARKLFRLLRKIDDSTPLPPPPED
jgi:ribosome-associated protein